MDLKEIGQSLLMHELQKIEREEVKAVLWEVGISAWSLTLIPVILPACPLTQIPQCFLSQLNPVGRFMKPILR